MVQYPDDAGWLRWVSKALERRGPSPVNPFAGMATGKGSGNLRRVLAGREARTALIAEQSLEG
jgi:hypothetical protein